MKRRFVLIAALVLIGLTFVVWRATSSRTAIEPSELVAPAIALASDHDHDHDHATGPAPPRTDSARVALDPTAADSNASDEPPTHVGHGRVMTVEGDPIAGARVAWWIGFLDRDRWKPIEQLSETTTNADGRFEIRVRQPRPHVVGLSVDAGPRLEWAHLAAGSARDTRRWVPGENDLGEVVLRPRGAVSGRVVGPDDAPRVGVEVSAHAAKTGLGSASVTDDRGEFVVGGLDRGRVIVSTSGEGFAQTEVSGVLVEHGQITPIGTLRLAPGKKIRGIVSDESGEPLDGVFVFANEVQGRGSVHKTRTRNGAFELSVDLPEAYELRASATPDPFVNDRPADYTVTVGSDAQDVHLVLARPLSWTIAVVDGITGAPVESFSASVGERPRSRTFQPQGVDTPFEFHEGGLARLTRTRSSNYVHVECERHAPMRVSLKPDDGRTDHQTIRVFPGAEIRGRVLRGGVPLAWAVVSCAPPPGLTQGATVALSSDAAAPGGPSTSAEFPPVEFHPEPRFALTDDEGAFSLRGLAATTFRVVARAPDEIEAQQVFASVKHGEVLDLGAIGVEPGGTISGTLNVPAPYRILDHELSLVTAPADQRGWIRTISILDSRGRFEMRAIPAGTYELKWHRRGEIPTSARAFAPPAIVVVESGQHQEVRLDTRSSLPYELSITTLQLGRPAPNLMIEYVPRPVDKSKREGRHTLGRTDDSGRLLVEVKPGSRFDLVVRSNAGAELARTPEPILAATCGLIEQKFDLRFGTIAVEIPPGLTPEPQSAIRVRVGGNKGYSRYFVFEADDVVGKRVASRPWSADTFPLVDVPPGTWPIRIEIGRCVGGKPDDGWDRLELTRPRRETTVEVVDCQETRIVLP